ncbi:MAG: hypothetical protein HY543_09395, partial [Deltaproteobacteria bacterium]|nr:hypothetical protein [Deltaproteobacteria bacterium]
MAIDGIKRDLGADVKPRLVHPDVLEALRKGNIQEILQALPAGVTKQDVEEYLKQQWMALDQGLLQNTQIKADAGAIPPVTMEEMLPMAAEYQLTEEDRALLQQGLGIGKAGKAAALKL